MNYKMFMRPLNWRVYSRNMFFEAMHSEWQRLLPDAKSQLESIEARLGDQAFLPSSHLVMSSFEVDPNLIRVVIVGQDPYPKPGNPIGRAFAVALGTRPLPGSLRNILKELSGDLGQPHWLDETLQTWVDQGVMLVNRHLTCSPGVAGSHQKTGWDEFTDSAISALAKLHGKKLVVLLWGNQAQQLAELCKGANIILGTHPSPLSANRGFFGSKPFSNINGILSKSGQPIIDWLGENNAPRF